MTHISRHKRESDGGLGAEPHLMFSPVMLNFRRSRSQVGGTISNHDCLLQNSRCLLFFGKSHVSQRMCACRHSVVRCEAATDTCNAFAVREKMSRITVCSRELLACDRRCNALAVREPRSGMTMYSSNLLSWHNGSLFSHVTT